MQPNLVLLPENIFIAHFGSKYDTKYSRMDQVKFVEDSL